MERVAGIGPTSKRWERFILPLNYARTCLASSIWIFSLSERVFLLSSEYIWDQSFRTTRLRPKPQVQIPSVAFPLQRDEKIVQ